MAFDSRHVPVPYPGSAETFPQSVKGKTARKRWASKPGPVKSAVLTPHPQTTWRRPLKIAKCHFLSLPSSTSFSFPPSLPSPKRGG